MTFMTQALYRDDAYLKSASATLKGVNERGGLIFDRTLFYVTGGGQPGDSGWLTLDDGTKIDIATTVYDSDRTTPVHVPAEPLEPGRLTPGTPLELTLDWQRRYAHMRTHTCLHLLCSLIEAPVTGGQIDVAKGRLDFDLPEAGLDKDALSEELQALIDGDHPVSARWISDAELDANPGLVRTMSVQPPRGSGKVRLIAIGDVDLQPCGGTHVASTREIGAARVTKIEKKGAQNRRVRIELTES